MSLAARATWRILSALLSAIILYSCAKTGLPPGGAEDKTGPTIIAHYPLADATNVERKLVAMLEFSEPVNRASVESSLYLTPEPGNRLKYRWHGRTLELVYLDSLAENRTYVISVGSAVKDQRGNPAGEPYTIAFSTGDQIDRGRLRGIIADEENPQTVSIWVYDLAATPEPNPTSDLADYALQADRNGNFTFGYLRLGNYRAFAVHDRNLNRQWDISSENIGLPPWDVSITESGESYLSFRLSNQDTSALKITRVKEIDAQRFELRTNRTASTIASIRFISPEHQQIECGKTCRALDDPSTTLLFPDLPLTAGSWRVDCIASDGKSTFSLSDSLMVRARSDTSRPKILAMEPDGKSPARLLTNLSIIWDEPVAFADDFLDSALVTGSQRDTSRLVRIEPPAGAAGNLYSLYWEFNCDPPFREGERYALNVDGRRIMDRDSNRYADTTVVLNVAFYSADSLGGIRGLVVDASNRAARAIVQRVAAKSDTLTALINNGQFTFERLVPGEYLVEIAAGTKSDLYRYNFGALNPLQFSDPFTISQDTITVRARWDTEVTIRWDVHP